MMKAAILTSRGPLTRGRGPTLEVRFQTGCLQTFISDYCPFREVDLFAVFIARQTVSVNSGSGLK